MSRHALVGTSFSLRQLKEAFAGMTGTPDEFAAGLIAEYPFVQVAVTPEGILVLSTEDAVVNLAIDMYYGDTVQASVHLHRHRVLVGHSAPTDYTPRHES